MTYDYDVLIFDAVGVPFTGYTSDFGGLGGSEWEQVLLLEALAARGYRVAAMNRLPSWSRVRGVDYHPIGTLDFAKFSCKSLILLRNTAKPLDIDCQSVFRWVTDTLIEYEDDGAELICVSKWQSDLHGDDHPQFIHNMLPDWVYDLKPNRNTKANSFIYASAAMKGLTPTLQYFSSMRKTKEFKNATLTVLNPGYDLPGGIEVEGVSFKGALPFRAVVEEMQAHRSMLMVSVFCETFGIVQVLAELLGLNLFIHQSQGRDALSEVCNSPTVTADGARFNATIALYGQDPQKFRPVVAKDFRVSSLIGYWESLLGLATREMTAPALFAEA